MNVRLILKSENSLEELSVTAFSFRKSVYTPYTMLNASFIAENTAYSEVYEVMFYIGEKLVHHGLADSFEVKVRNGVKTGKIISKGFTSMLLQNQLEPGIINNVSLNSLLDNYYDLSFISHEDNSDQQNYIYVQNHSSMWDGVVTLAYKLTGNYPFIESANCVRITPKSQPQSFSFADDEILSCGFGNDFSSFISGYDMPDIAGDYGVYTLSDYEMMSKKIVRHKYIEFDREYLYNPQEALVFRKKFSEKAGIFHYCEYSGYKGEDLTDHVSFGSLLEKKIGFLSVRGNPDGIFTKVGIYFDSFSNP